MELTVAFDPTPVDAAILPLPMMSPVEALTRGFDLPAAPTKAPADALRVRGAYSDSADSTNSEPHLPRRQDEVIAGEQRRQGFRIGDLGLMIRYAEGSELTDIPAIHRLPNTVDWFCGIANLHGLLLPVFDLALYLGVKHAPEAKQMLLVLSHGVDAACVMIDNLPERLRWTEKDRINADTAPTRLAPHVRATCLLADKLWFDLDCTSLLNTLEQALKAG